MVIFISRITDAAVSPRNVRATVVSSTVISVQWDGLSPCSQVNGLIVEYRVQYTAESSGMVQSIDQTGEWNVTGAEASLTGLTPSTNYFIQVAAVNEQGDVGLYSESIRIQTAMDGDNSCDDLTVSLNCSHASTSSNTILTPSVIGAIAAGVVVAALCILIIIACILK